MPENIGHVIQIAGPAVDVQFTEGHLPPDLQALRVVSDGFNVPTPINVILEVQQHLGEGRVRCVAMEPTDGMVRGMKAIDQGGPITVPVGRGTLGRVMNVIGEPVDQLGPIDYTEANADSSPGSCLRRAGDHRRNVRDRREGHRSHPAFPQGRQDRIVRRRGRGQDRRNHGAHQQRRQAARRLLGVRRSRRAHPRRQRSVAGDDGVRRNQARRSGQVQGRADLRPDDGASRSASARGLDRPDGRRIFPRRRRRGHAAVHRQHFPFHPGRFGSFRAAGPHAQRRRIPAESGYRNGRIAGAHHLHQEGFGHLGAGDLCSRRRFDRSRRRPPRSLTSTRPRCCRAR